MKTGSRKKRLVWHIFLVLAITTALLISPLFLVQIEGVQNWALKRINAVSPWQIAWDRFDANLLRLDFEWKNLSLQHQQQNRKIQLEKLVIDIAPLHLLRGKIYFSNILADSIVAELGERTETDNKPAESIDLKKVFLIQNMAIERARFQDITIYLPKQKELHLDSLNSHFEANLFGKVTLDINGQAFILTSPESAPFTFSSFTTSLSTELSSWSNRAPFINQAAGELSIVEPIKHTKLCNQLFAHLTFQDGNLNLSNLTVHTGSHALTGSLAYQTKEHTFQLDLEMPKSVRIPNIGPDYRVFNTAGEATGTIHLEGRNFDLKNSAGKGKISLAHRFDNLTDVPIKLKSGFTWSKGVATLHASQLTAREHVIDLSGSIDFLQKNFDFGFSTSQFPLEYVFQNFGNENFHPISALAAADGTITGWGKDFDFSLKGIARSAAYNMYHAEKIAVSMKQNYDQLILNGHVFSDEKSTGKVYLKVDFEEKEPNQPRDKKVYLKADLLNHPLEETLPDYSIAGAATGFFVMQGPSDHPQGHGKMKVERGVLFDREINIEEGTFKLNGLHQLSIENANLRSPLLESPIQWKQPVTFDFSPGQVEIKGNPIEHFKLHLTYHYDEKNYRIHNLLYQDPTHSDWKTSVKGLIGWEAADFTLNGRLDLSRIRPFIFQLREGSGPIDFNLHCTHSLRNPKIDGHLTLNRNPITFRDFYLQMENLEGELKFAERKITTPMLKGNSDFGSFSVSGWLTHQDLSPSYYDLGLSANQLPYRNLDLDLRMEFDAEVTLKGKASQPTLSGNAVILDAKYSKDFKLLDELKERAEIEEQLREYSWGGPPIQLQLNLTNTGEFVIDNNVGEINLGLNVQMTGVYPNPVIAGTIEVLEGNIHYLGFDFEISKGFIEYQTRYSEPYLEIQATREMDLYTLNLLLYGRTSNLALDLSGTSRNSGQLAKKDVISLLTFGTTSRDLEERRLLENQAPGFFAEQLSVAMERPITQATRVDIFRLEAEPTEGGSVQQRLHIGKKISDRWTVAFSTDVNSEEAVQTFRTEYQLTDFLLFKGSRSTDRNFELNLGFRIRTR